MRVSERGRVGVLFSNTNKTTVDTPKYRGFPDPKKSVCGCGDRYSGVRRHEEAMMRGLLRQWRNYSNVHLILRALRRAPSQRGRTVAGPRMLEGAVLLSQ